MSYGWAGTIEEFKSLDRDFFIEKLQFHIYKTNKAEQDMKAQIKAWIDSYNKLQELFSNFNNLDASLIFEYEILRGGGRRPDVLLLLNGHVIVIECKSYNRVASFEYIQTSLYMRDLEHYHSAIQEKRAKVIGILLLTNYPGEQMKFNNNYQVTTSTVKSLENILNKLLNKQAEENLTIQDIINGVYEPSPSMLEAARSIYKNEELPQIKAVSSSNFSKVQETVDKIVEEAKKTNSHHLILVSGEPGAGKTYLGLTVAHEMDNAVYLSGNGPLISVLQDILQNRTFVQGLYGYKMDYLEKRIVPKEQIIIFDEAQRAWDAKKVDESLEKKRLNKQNLSEPDIMMNIATTNKSWSVTIGLIGEGQEIYSGEEGGLDLWNRAITGKRITVHSKHPNELFNNAFKYQIHENLHLNSSLRTHTALKYYEIINELLAANFEMAKTLIKKLPKERYHFFITRDLNTAKSTVGELYQSDSKTAGIVCAGGADRQKEVPVLPRDERYERPSNITKYFNYPDAPFYCRSLSYSVTEFQAQGLELDMSLVHWDDDLFLQNKEWKGQHYQWGVEDPFQIKLNAYRVILTRGRDGTIIYIPKKAILDETWKLLKDDLEIPEL